MSRINNQIQHRISTITILGEKKKEAQKDAREIHIVLYGSLKGYNPAKTYTIRSINTAKAYRKCGEYFANWLKEVKGINKINLVTTEVAGEYLQYRDEYCSAWTVKQDMAAINKIFKFNLKSKEIGLKQRKLIDIKRSRNGPEVNRPGLLTKCKEQIFFIRSCGCRRDSIMRVKYSDIVFKNGLATGVRLIEKGGKERTAPVLEQYQTEFTDFTNRHELHPNEAIFKLFDTHVAAHFYRAQYAKNLYKELFNRIGNEKHEKYKGYDKEVLKQVSKALGHNRVNVVVDNYMY